VAPSLVSCPLFFGDIGGACGMVAVALDALVTFTIEAALVGCWTAERDGEAAVEESVDLEAAGWWSGADGRRSCRMVEAAGWIGGMVAPLAGRIGGFGGIWWRRCLRDGGARLYMALQYYQNIPIVSFVGCTDGGA